MLNLVVSCKTPKTGFVLTRLIFDTLHFIFRYFYVRADKVMKLRHLLDKLGNISGMMNEEKDPEEFLNLLLNEIMRAEPFLYIRYDQNCQRQFRIVRGNSCN